MHIEPFAETQKTNQDYWNGVWGIPVKMELPSILLVNSLNIMRLLKSHVKPRSKYVEIGCAPGKMLAWVSKVLRTNSSGLDYSEVGITKCKHLFEALNLDIDLYCVDFTEHKVPLEQFDFVTSFGLIEHFEDPALLVKQHIDLLKPNGMAIITIPNYGGIYGRVQKWCDPENIDLHNLNIMTTQALESLVDRSKVSDVRAYYFGKIDPLILSLEKKMPVYCVKLINILLNGIGLLQPIVLSSIAPLLVLEVRK